MDDDYFLWSLKNAPSEDAEDLMHWRDLYKRFSRRKPSNDGNPCAEDLEGEAAWLLIARIAQNKLGEKGVDGLFRQAGWYLNENRGKELERQLSQLHRIGVHDCNPYDENLWNLLSPKLRAEYWHFLVRGRLLQVLESSGHIDFHDIGDYGELPPRISSLICNELLWIEFQTLEKPDIRWFNEPEVWFYERNNATPPPDANSSRHKSYPVSCAGLSPGSPPVISTTTHYDDSPDAGSSNTISSSRPDNMTKAGKPEPKTKRVTLEQVTPEIRTHLHKNPNATAKEIANAVGCSRGTVINSLPWKAISGRRKEERGKSARRVHGNIDIAVENKSFENHDEKEQETLDDLIDEQERDDHWGPIH